MDKLIEIFYQFNPDNEVSAIYAYGSGHINDTYKVETAKENYLLQRINSKIFKNVEGLTTNIVKVTEFLKSKLDSKYTEMQVLNPGKTKAGNFVYQDVGGSYWRVFDFIENSKSFDLVENEKIAYEGGKAYGWFVKMLADFPAEELEITIPDFHNADFRIETFRRSVKANVACHASKVRDLISELDQRADEMNEIHLLGEQGLMPQRVTHNDTKINNILFNKDNKGICVIDLDTVMPGYVHYDFGDAVRTFTNTGNEDEADLNKVSMDINLFEGFTKGFLSETREVLNTAEIELLAFSAKYIVYEQAIRFFSDYLDGDIYYKIKFTEHNLVRTKAQFKLLQSIEEQFEQMQQIIIKLASA